MLAQIGDTDITMYIQESTYNVNNDDVQEQWTDANLIDHMPSIRTRVTGEFELVFVTDEALDDFITLLQNNTTDGYVTMTIMVNNENRVSEHQLFYKFASLTSRIISTNYVYKRFKMTITER